MAIIIQDPSGTLGFSTMRNGIYLLKGIVKHYDWGGFSFIPSLLQQENSGERPFAEYWMGIHPLGTSLVDINGKEKKLSEVEPRLPFLFKVLDVKDMLSIQVHPSKVGAVAGFEEEEKKGIPADSPLRNYRDKNHKPELMVALSDFWLLHGFKQHKELEFTLLNVAELRELLPVYNRDGNAGLYKYVMEMPQEEVNRILEPLITNIEEVYKETSPEKEDEDYWVAKAAKMFCPPGHIDRGIFSIYLLNLVHLQKGEAIFQDAGIPHAYLEGQNVEIMANSDNVLRGGLTNKHISVADLMKHVKTEPVLPQVIQPEKISEVEKRYQVPVSDFQLSIIELDKEKETEISTSSTEIIFISSGEAQIESKEQHIKIGPGQPAIVVLPGTHFKIKAETTSQIFRATGQVLR